VDTIVRKVHITIEIDNGRIEITTEIIQTSKLIIKKLKKRSQPG
jgi:hypothetical protein